MMSLVYTILTGLEPKLTVQQLDALEITVVQLLQQQGYTLRTNAVAGTGYLGSTATKSIVYLPEPEYQGLKRTLQEPSDVIVTWAKGLLKKTRRIVTPINMSYVYSIYGYNNPILPKFIIIDDKYTHKSFEKLIPKDIPVLLVTSPNFIHELKEVIIAIHRNSTES